MFIVLLLACVYRVYRPRVNEWEFLDTTPVDMRRADDGKDYEHREDGPPHWSWPTT